MRVLATGTAFRALLIGALAFAMSLMLFALPAQARNVPGSAAMAQRHIDGAAATAVLNTTLVSIQQAMRLNACQDFVRDTDGEELRDPCEWGFSVNGGVLHLEDAPDGYDFTYTMGYGSMVIARSLSPTATLLGVVIAESGTGELEFSDGTLTGTGVGALVGGVFKLNETLDFSIVGGAEWLNYKTTRSDGLFEGDYDAVRYLADAELRGLYDGGTFFLEYGGGLRFVHQVNGSYQETSEGLPGAEVASSHFTRLTALGDIKLGAIVGNLKPYVQATGFATLYDDTSADSVATLSNSMSARLGVGVEAEMFGGSLGLATGFFADQDGIDGYDASFRFAKSF